MEANFNHGVYMVVSYDGKHSIVNSFAVAGVKGVTWIARTAR